MFKKLIVSILVGSFLISGCTPKEKTEAEKSIEEVQKVAQEREKEQKEEARQSLGVMKTQLEEALKGLMKIEVDENELMLKLTYQGDFQKAIQLLREKDEKAYQLQMERNLNGILENAKTLETSVPGGKYIKIAMMDETKENEYYFVIEGDKVLIDNVTKKE